MVKQLPRIGFFGTGRMGAPMVRSLLRNGYRVAVWNRTPEKYAALLSEGASAPGTPRDVAAESDVLIAMLWESAHLDAILSGPEGILAGLRPNSIFIDMGTSPPRHAQQLAELFAKHSVGSLDAPCRGNVQAAVDATLLIPVGGGKDVFERASPVLEAIGKTIVYVGEAGSGQTALACHQIIMAVTTEAVAEALALAKVFGADQERVRDVLLAGLSNSPVLRSRSARMIARDWEAGHPVKLWLKDRANVADALQGTSLRLPIAEAVYERIHEFVQRGHGELDDSALYMLLDP